MKTPIQLLHERTIAAHNKREQQKAESLRQKPGYDSIGQNQYAYSGVSQKGQGK